MGLWCAPRLCVGAAVRCHSLVWSCGWVKIFFFTFSLLPVHMHVDEGSVHWGMSYGFRYQRNPLAAATLTTATIVTYGAVKIAIQVTAVFKSRSFVFVMG